MNSHPPASPGRDISISSIVDFSEAMKSDGSALRKAKRANADRVSFTRQNAISGPLRAELDLFGTQISESTEYLNSVDHKAVFIGPVGVGKTTAISSLPGLSQSSGEGKKPRLLLAVSGGRTTICEVELVSGSGYAIEVEPLDRGMAQDLVNQFAAQLWHEFSPTCDSVQTGEGLPHEFKRALRNMAALANSSHRDCDDPLAELQRNHPSLESFRDALHARIKLWERNRVEFRFDDEADSFEAARKVFADINYGRLPDAPLPKRIIVSSPVISDECCNLNIVYVDTKGVDETVRRSDLDRYLGDPRSLILLCSSFNDAPNESVTRILRDLIDGGDRDAIETRIMLLVLAKNDEPLAVVDQMGEEVDSTEAGLEIKKAQIEAALRKIGTPQIPVRFLDSHNSNAGIQLRNAVEFGLFTMRSNAISRIDGVVRSMRQSMANHKEAAANAARREVMKRIRLFLSDAPELSYRSSSIADRLLEEMMGTHSSSVRASMNRRGAWLNLDIGACLAQSGRESARQRSDRVSADLEAVLKIVMSDPDLESAKDLARGIRDKARASRKTFIHSCGDQARDCFMNELMDDEAFWRSVRTRWGAGSGYRSDVIAEFKRWFSSASFVHKQYEEFVLAAWKRSFIDQILQSLAE